MDQFNNNNQPIVEETVDRYERRNIPWVKISLLCMLAGVILFAAGWATGSRGGRVYLDRGLRVVSYPLPDDAESGRTVDFTSTAQVREIVANTISDSITFIPTTDNAVRVVGMDVRVTETNGVLNVDARPVGSVITGTNFSWFRGGAFVGRHGMGWVREGDSRFFDFNFDFSNFWQFGSISNAVRVYVPSGVNVIEARSVSGSVRIEDISTTSLNLQSTSGSINVNGGTHADTRLRSTSGSVRFDGNLTAGIDASSTSGSVRITDNSTQFAAGSEISLRSTSGSVSFTTAAPASAFSYSMSVTSGSMRVDGNRISGRNTSGGSGNIPINARSTSGGVTLEFGR